ncbi:RNA dependent RNA polymerase-domain-containing protein [Lentinula raphanica]|nr:RNA dependent RNA polymerase-domain-containing protein [Lentinula raphanica]
MEIYMTNIDTSLSKYDLTRHLAKIFHGPGYHLPGQELINFEVNLSPRTEGTGFLALPTISIAAQFLEEYGERDDGYPPDKDCVVGGQAIEFVESYYKPRPEIVDKITRLPFQDPTDAENEEQRQMRLEANSVSLAAVQFGWLDRDGVISIEWEHACTHAAGQLSFSSHPTKGPPEILIKIPNTLNTAIIRFPLTFVRYVSTHVYSDSTHYGNEEQVIYFNLFHFPSFEVRSQTTSRRASSERVSFLPLPGHETVAPFVSDIMRLVCTSESDLRVFRELFRLAQTRPMKSPICREPEDIERRNIYEAKSIDRVKAFSQSLEWKVAFQVDSLVQCRHVSVREMVTLMPEIRSLVRLKGSDHTASVLRHFAHKVQRWYANDADADHDYDSIEHCFTVATKSYAKSVEEEEMSSNPPSSTQDLNTFTSYHVTVTPSSYLLGGPFIERSNRVIRWFDPSQHELFLKVRFVDEGDSKYRHDRNIDGKLYIRNRIGSVLSNGLTIAGRKFKFLAYTQSSLKDHTVWFYRHPGDSVYVDSTAIIQQIANFQEPEIRRCPALYGARISQAFTATEAPVAEVEEVIPMNDKLTLDGQYNFTDGVGTMSREFAAQVWNELKKTSKRTRNRTDSVIPCFQIRYGGSKGMLSIDYKLKGNVICIRKSMTKFASMSTREIEVAQFFDRPLRLKLNRPLIMILEDLGVPYEAFKDLQDKAIEQTFKATESLATAARLFENFGLGNSFRLTSILLGLSRLGVDNLIQGEPFYQSMLNYAVHHILRELKHHTRIPVEGAWNLVGVADEHGYLQEGEIFAAIKQPNGPVQYLEGECLVTRSPVIHPGDCQIAKAIGPPPPGSCFDHEPLINTVVFPIKGSRPMPSMLGGGDLDGDTYNIIPFNVHPQLRPDFVEEPASYTRPKKKLLNQDCKLEDVAEFIVEYVNSDLVGLIATRWLLIADQNVHGVLDDDCLELARLHSDAVDYPKTGKPVDFDEVPKPHFFQRPDWSAPETASSTSPLYYKSTRAIGRLYRDISLPPVESTISISLSQQRKTRSGKPSKPVVDNSIFDTFVDDDDLHLLLQGSLVYYDIDIHNIGQETRNDVSQRFQDFIMNFEGIATTYTLSSATSALAEEEIILGTIAAKTPHLKGRNEKMARLRDLTQALVKDIRNVLTDEQDLKTTCERAWSAWDLSRKQTAQAKFGARGFQYIALGLLFDAIKELEEDHVDEGGETQNRLKRKSTSGDTSNQKRSRYITTQEDEDEECFEETDMTADIDMPGYDSESEESLEEDYMY